MSNIKPVGTRTRSLGLIGILSCLTSLLTVSVSSKLTLRYTLTVDSTGKKEYKSKHAEPLVARKGSLTSGCNLK
jgi:hypothetical protein